MGHLSDSNAPAASSNTYGPLNTGHVQRARAEMAQKKEDDIMQQALAADRADDEDIRTWQLTVRAIVPGYPGLTRVFRAQVHAPVDSQPPVVQFQLSTTPYSNEDCFSPGNRNLRV